MRARVFHIYQIVPLLKTALSLKLINSRLSFWEINSAINQLRRSARSLSARTHLPCSQTAFYRSAETIVVTHEVLINQ